MFNLQDKYISLYSIYTYMLHIIKYGDLLSVSSTYRDLLHPSLNLNYNLSNNSSKYKQF